MSDRMPHDRWKYLMQQFTGDESVVLTKEEVEEGWHWCDAWDGLLLHPDNAEFAYCTCEWMEKFRTPERKEKAERYIKRMEALEELQRLDDEQKP